MTSTKPYVIAKRAVWEAYQQVKANRGAAGIDDETIAMFEQDLSKNLYKLWNRMSSGSYFPPPVKQVDSEGIPHGICHLSFPLPSRTRFSRSIPKPALRSCRLYTDCHRVRKQVSSRLILEPMVVPSSGSILRQ
jgi:hypothetical protein